jgi:hypothetical protein
VFSVEWEFLPAPGRIDEFVAAYGATGPWVALFRRAPGYLGTDFLPLAGRPGWYRTIDRWTSADACAAFRTANAAEYGALDIACARLTAQERHVRG